jgi:hypothetical protein
MTIDYTPAIRAFVEERIRHLRAVTNFIEGRENMIDELELILKLCDGLTKQNELLTKALGI